MTKTRRTATTVDLITELDTALEAVVETREALDAASRIQVEAKTAYDQAVRTAEGLQAKVQDHLSGLLPAAVNPTRVRQG